jgi:hypothetical protein
MASYTTNLVQSCSEKSVPNILKKKGPCKILHKYEGSRIAHDDRVPERDVPNHCDIPNYHEHSGYQHSFTYINNPDSQNISILFTYK